jgi:trigger factor
VLGEGGVLPQFEEALPGASAGDTREVEVEFPAEYPAAEVAGKTARFSVTVREVAAARLPEVDEDFARSFGIPDGDVARLRSEVRANMERELGDQVRARIRARVFDAILERNREVEMPSRLVESEVDRLIGERRTMMESRGIDPDSANIERTQFENDARRRVALGLILAEIVRQSELRPDPDRVRSRIEQMALGYDDPEGFVQWYYSERERLAQIEALIVEEQAVEHLLAGADVDEKSMGFRDFMLAGPAAAGAAPAAETSGAQESAEGGAGGASSDNDGDRQ